MKYLKNFYFMIKEAVDTYDIKSEVNKNNFVIKYEFDDDDYNRFMVQFKNDTIGSKSKPMLGNSYELTWYVWDDKIDNWSVTKVVNSNVWKILHTIFGVILRDFVLKNPLVTEIRFEGLAKEVEKNYLTQRTKLYLRHLKNNPVTGFRLENFGSNRIILRKIKK
jgi:hypothetical protein